MATEKLSILSVDNFQQRFGNSDYAMFSTTTPKGDSIVTGLSYNLLQSRGINTDLLDSLVGSTILVNDSTDIRTGEFIEGNERVRKVVDKEPNNSVLLISKANGSLIKSELYATETINLASSTQAKFLVEKEKERKNEAARRMAQKLAAKLSAPVDAQPKGAQLETNEDPF
jgi:hypothetical protein